MTAPGRPSASDVGAWADACLIADLVALDPAGLGGAVVRGGAGPARDRWLARLREGLPDAAPARRAPLHIADDRLLGGLDLAASLSVGRAVAQRGLLVDCDGGVVVLTMAERIEADAAARIAAVMDQAEVAIEREGLTQRWPARFGVIALDDGIGPDEQPPAALMDRLAFRLDLTYTPRVLGQGPPSGPQRLTQARNALADQAPPSDQVIEALCTAAAHFGVTSPRGTLLALRAAAAHAALNGRSAIEVDDLAVGARLVLAPRATQAPQAAEPHEEAAPESDAQDRPPDAAPQDAQPSDPQDIERAQTEALNDLAVAAVRAALPPSLGDDADYAAPPRARPSRARGEGAAVRSTRRGRPVGSRPGVLRPGDRLDLPQTLRAAAPWQRLRRHAAGLDQAPTPANDATRIRVRTDDFRIRRFVQRSESTTIFVVDASGSAALHRLGEAKGAVELLLANAYVSRTSVALIAFAGRDARVLLTPTRSLTRAKRQLCDLAGGGGTPLASAIDAALTLALSERAKDRTPRLVFLTDGRANLGRDGAPGRAAAEHDALEAAHRVRSAAVASVFIDTSPRPQPNGDRYALAMGGRYAPLPYVDASAVFSLVEGSAPDRTLSGAKGAA